MFIVHLFVKNTFARLSLPSRFYCPYEKSKGNPKVSKLRLIMESYLCLFRRERWIFFFRISYLIVTDCLDRPRITCISDRQSWVIG